MATRKQKSSLRRKTLRANQEPNPRLLAQATRPGKLVKALGEQARKAAYLLVTDGSGSQGNRPCGFASLLVAHTDEKASSTLLTGRLDAGTSQFAELMAVWSALSYLESLAASKRKEGAHVLVITDNTTVATYLGWLREDVRKCYTETRYPMLAAGLLRLQQRGYIIDVYQLKRNTTPAHALVDAASKAARVDGLVDPAKLSGHKFEVSLLRQRERFAQFVKDAANGKQVKSDGRRIAR